MTSIGKNWGRPYFFLLFFAVLSACAWMQWAWPRYAPIDLKIDQPTALKLAKEFLKNKEHLNPESFHSVIVFDVDEQADRYLQHTLGVKASQEFINKYNYDLFYWQTRFFNEGKKEEYQITISSKTGRVIAFNHELENSAPRPAMEEALAKTQALEFAQARLPDTSQALVVDDIQVKQLDHRTEYHVDFRYDNVYIPWAGDQVSKGAKIITSVVISGSDTLSFLDAHLEIPDTFNRHISNLKQTGEILTLLFRIIYLMLITIAIFLVVNRKGHLVERRVKPFYTGIAIFLFVLMGLGVFNEFNEIIYYYLTSQSLFGYVLRMAVGYLMVPFFLVIAFILPSIAGEGLAARAHAQEHHRGILGLLQSSWTNRFVTQSICIGYLTAVIVLGVQAIIFELGFRYAGVWQEMTWLTKSSTAMVPALAALLLAAQASFTEETMFRLFGIQLGARYLKNIALAIFLSSVAWGFGHTGYLIFPMWFRGLEVTIIGLILGAVYWRFGLIATLIAHFLMDAFLMSVPYLVQPAWTQTFIGAVVILLLPALWALFSWLMNHSVEVKVLKHHFNASQQFNYNLLISLMKSKNPEEREAFAQELLMHGWDHTVVEAAKQI